MRHECPYYPQWQALACHFWCHLTMHDLGLIELPDPDLAERMGHVCMSIAMLRSGPLLLGDLYTMHPRMVLVPRKIVPIDIPPED